ncbi:MAG: transcriptional regulator [Rhodanobacter sp.]|nr:MAG: transcriptional regulator [Rhodanobacter sp.]
MTKNIPLDAVQESEEAHRRKVVTRLARIEGQVRGIQGMITDNCSCEQVALQLTAARRALDRAFYEMIACSLNSHVEAAGDMDEIRASTKDLARLLAKFG